MMCLQCDTAVDGDKIAHFYFIQHLTQHFALNSLMIFFFDCVTSSFDQR